MPKQRYTECTQYYAGHIASKIGAVVTTLMLSALFVLFIMGRSTVDYTALHIPQKEEKIRVIAMKIRTITEKEIQAKAQEITVPPPQKKKHLPKKNTKTITEKKIPPKKDGIITKTEDTVSLPQNTTESIPFEEESTYTQKYTPAVVKEENTPQYTAPLQHEENTPTQIQKALSSLVQSIEQYKTYPRLARRAGYEGIVQLQVFIDENGFVRSYSLHASSQHTMLDSSALEAIAKIKGKKIIEEQLKTSIEAVIPIRYSLGNK